MSSESSTTPTVPVVVDNKQLQGASNNNNNNVTSAAAASSAAPAVVAVDNKSASRVSLSTIYSPSPVPSTSQSVVHAAAKLKAAALPSTGASSHATQRPLEISIAIDVSGSMSGDRLNTAKESMNFVLEQLRPGDSLGIVSFSNDARIVLPMTKMSPQGKTSAGQSINSLVASGSTNLSDGLFMALNQVTGASTAAAVSAASALYNGPVGNFNPYINPALHSFYPGINQPALCPPPPYAGAAPQTIPVEISHQYNGNGNKPEEKHQYKVKIVAPDDKISKFTIHDPQARFADILGSGETEFDLQPLPTSIQQLEIIFEVVDGQTPHKVTYFLGEVASGKRTINVPAATTTSATGSNNNNNSNSHDDGVLRVVMLFTDGHANLGIQDSPSLVREAKRALAASPKDATIFTFGFGANYNADMLQQIATATEGMFYFVETTAVMPEIFADCLGGLLSTVAQNVKVTARLTPGNGIRFGTAMTKFKTQIEDNGNTLVITMKDLYAEEERDILLELKVDGTTAKASSIDSSGVGIEWTLEFSDATNPNKSAAKVTLASKCVFTISSDSEPVVNNEVDVQVQRYTSIQVMAEVREAADRGDLERARQQAQAYTAQLQCAPSAAMPSNMMLQQQMMNLEQLASNESEWNARGSKQSHAYAQSHALQRGNAVTDDCAYAGNAMKMEMRSKAKKSSS